MKKLFWIVLALTLFSNAAFAQTTTNPVGGLTIKTLHIEDGGWAFVEFEESVPEIDNNCAAASTIFGTFPEVLWLDPAQAGTEEVYSTLLAAHLAGVKVSGITLYNLGSYCSLYAVRL